MMKNIKILGVIFSVVLNIIFVGSYFYHRSGPLAMTGRQVNHNHLLHEELNLDRAQLDRLKPLSEGFHAFVNSQGRKIKVKQLELVNLLAKAEPDRRAIGEIQVKIQALQRQMQAKVIDHFFAEGKIFTSEQRQKFFSMIKGRMEKGNAPRPRWMPQKHVNSSMGQRP